MSNVAVEDFRVDGIRACTLKVSPRILESLFFDHTFHTDVLKVHQLFCIFRRYCVQKWLPIDYFAKMPKRKKPVEGNLDGSGKGESKKQKIGNVKTLIKLKKKSRSAISSMVKDNFPRNDYLRRRIETGKRQ